MSKQWEQDRGRERDDGVAEPPMRLIMACMAIGMIVGALLSPGRPTFVNPGSGAAMTAPVGQ